MRIDGIVPQRAGPYGSSPLSAGSARHRSPGRRGPEEWGNEEGGGGISAQTAPVPASIHAVGVEYLEDRIVSLADDVEVDQVDRRPRREQIQQQREKIPEAIDEIVRGDQRHPVAASAAIARLPMRLPAVQRSGLSVSATLSSVSEAP